MVRVDSKKPCKLVYSLCKHPYMGFVIEPHIVQLNANGAYSLSHQKLYSQTAKEFDACLDEDDYKLIKLLDQLDQEFVIKKHYKEKIRPAAYFAKIWNDKIFQIVRPILEKKIVEALRQIKQKPFFEMGKDGDPVFKRLKINEDLATVLFHFRRSPEGTRYFPTIKLNGVRIEFMFKEAEIITSSPAFMLLGDQLLQFDQDLDGKKLMPFLNKRFVDIPKTAEASYYKKFIAPLIERHHVYAEGFQIITEQFEAFPIIKIIHAWDNAMQFVLSFQYGKYNFLYQSGTKVSVTVENKNDEFTFHRIKRSLTWEGVKINLLTELGLMPIDGSSFIVPNHTKDSETESIHHALDWLNVNHDQLLQAGFQIQQE